MDESVEGYLSEARARSQIMDALQRYCEGVDRVDEELISSAYHPDAYDDHGTYSGSATGFVEYAIAALRERLLATSHRLSNIRIEGRRTIEMLGGRYLDRFERRDEWRISHRRLVLDWHTQFDAPPLATGQRYNAGSRSRDDASYGLFAAVQSGRSWPSQAAG